MSNNNLVIYAYNMVVGDFDMHTRTFPGAMTVIAGTWKELSKNLGGDMKLPDLKVTAVKVTPDTTIWHLADVYVVHTNDRLDNSYGNCVRVNFTCVRCKQEKLTWDITSRAYKSCIVRDELPTFPDSLGMWSRE